MAKPLFRFNTNQLSTAVRRELAASPVKARRAMNAVGGFLNGEIKDLTPQEEGFLTGDVSNKTVEYKKSYAVVIFIPANSASSKYAIAMHENQYRLGPDSLEKQRKVGKVVGRKFIIRGIDGNRSTIIGIIAKELKI